MISTGLAGGGVANVGVERMTVVGDLQRTVVSLHGGE